MANNNQSQLKIWGRANSVNVQKVLWCLRELDLAYERIDAGMAFGKNTEPEYLAMNPNGRVPTLVDGDFVLWESNSVMRYLVLAYGQGSPIYPASAETPRRRRSLAGLDAIDACSRSIARCSGRWCAPRSKSATWSRSRRTPTPKPCNGGSSMPRWRRGASSRATISRIADIALGAYARRWFGVEGISKPKLRASRTLVRAIRRPARIPAIHRAADDVSSAIKIPSARTARCRQSPTSVIAVTTRRVVQFMPRLTHHSSAQLIMTGTMISSCKGLPSCRSARAAELERIRRRRSSRRCRCPRP